MNALSRWVSLTGGLALLAIAGCSGGSADSPKTGEPSASGGALANLDTCQIMKPDQLRKAGLPQKGERVELFDFEPGCGYNGDIASVSIAKNAEKTLKSYEDQTNWKSFERIQLKGRPAARALSAQATGDMCTMMLAAGKGVVVVGAMASDPRAEFDGCAKAREVAKMIEPNLPEPA